MYLNFITLPCRDPDTSPETSVLYAADADPATGAGSSQSPGRSTCQAAIRIAVSVRFHQQRT
jgi:hypothetical protein